MLTLSESLEILHLKNENFTEKELLDNYRTEAKKYHTDLNPNAKEDKMYIVNEAHSVLKEFLKNKDKKDSQNTQEAKNNVDLYKEKVAEYAKIFDLSYTEARYRYDTYKMRTGYTGSIIDYYESLMIKYYKNKDLIYSLYNELTTFNGSITYIIDEYEDNNKDKSLSIVEWLQNRVAEKKISQVLNINTREILSAYQNDQTYGYENTFNEYIRELYSFITKLNLEEINYNFIKINYKREISLGNNKTFIEYLKIRLQIELLKKETNTNSDELLYKIFETLEKNDTLSETVEEVKEKIFKKAKF